jgi:hypothetical protein
MYGIIGFRWIGNLPNIAIRRFAVPREGGLYPRAETITFLRQRCGRECGVHQRPVSGSTLDWMGVPKVYGVGTLCSKT